MPKDFFPWLALEKEVRLIYSKIFPAVALDGAEFRPPARLEGQWFEEMVRRASAFYVGVGGEGSIRKVVSFAYNKLATPEVFLTVAYRVACCKYLIVNNLDIALTDTDEFPCPVESNAVLENTLLAVSDGNEYIGGVFRLLSGQYAGFCATMYRQVLDWQVRIPELFGWNDRQDLRHPRELIGFRAQVIPAVRRGELKPVKIHVGDKHRGYNLRLRAKRNQPCPFRKVLPCFNCPAGVYDLLKCSRACRPWSQVQRKCSCGEDFYISPTSSTTLCKKCRKTAYTV